MTRSELAAKVGLKDDDVKKLFDTIKDEVKNGNKVDIAKFGAFEAIEKAARTARNPRTGESVQVAAKKAPKFKPSKTFKDEVNA